VYVLRPPSAELVFLQAVTDQLLNASFQQISSNPFKVLLSSLLETFERSLLHVHSTLRAESSSTGFHTVQTIFANSDAGKHLQFCYVSFLSRSGLHRFYDFYPLFLAHLKLLNSMADHADPVDGAHLPQCIQGWTHTFERKPTQQRLDVSSLSEMKAFRCFGADTFVVTITSDHAQSANAQLVITDSRGHARSWRAGSMNVISIKSCDSIQVSVNALQPASFLLAVKVNAFCLPASLGFIEQLRIASSIFVGTLLSQAAFAPHPVPERKTPSECQAEPKSILNQAPADLFESVLQKAGAADPEKPSSIFDSLSMNILRGGLWNTAHRCEHHASESLSIAHYGTCEGLIAAADGGCANDHILVRLCRESKRRNAQVFGSKSIDVAIADTFIAMLHHNRRILEEACRFLSLLKEEEIPSKMPAARGRMPAPVVSGGPIPPSSVVALYERAESLRVPLVKQRQKTKSQIFGSLSDLKIDPNPTQTVAIEASSESHVSQTSLRARFLLSIRPYAYCEHPKYGPRASFSDPKSSSSTEDSAGSDLKKSSGIKRCSDENEGADSTTSSELVLEFVQHWVEGATPLETIRESLKAIKTQAERRVECLHRLSELLKAIERQGSSFNALLAASIFEFKSCCPSDQV
jgi:hypothetical protein